MVRQVILGLMFSIGLHTASAQGTCETNFKADGDAKTGLHFATSVPLPASDMKDVVEQLKQASKDETWQIGSTDFGEPVTKLTVNQKQTPHSRGFPLFFSLNKNTATLTFESTLPAGMLARAGRYAHHDVSRSVEGQGQRRDSNR